jgi:chemotaxis protein methyltransferase CheR
VPITTSDFDFVRGLVRDRSAIVLEPGKEYLVESRLLSLVQRKGLNDIGTLVDELRRTRDGGLQSQVVEAMTTNETSFFRDIHPFNALRTTLLPELIESRSTERSIKIWSAACSSGQEPYTIAMLIRENFPALAAWNVSILGTDLSTEVLDRAREGRYAQLEVNRGLPAPLLVKYFEHHGASWVVKPDVKRAVEFRPMNLIMPWPSLPRFDFVFLRNVLIYFDRATKHQILERVRSVLRPDGYLFLGAAESTLNVHDGYERVALERAGCYRLRS